MNALTRAERALVESAEPAVTFTLNGREVTAQPGERFLAEPDAARTI